MMDRCEIGIFGKIQLKVNKKLGNVEIKAYFYIAKVHIKSV